MLNEETLKKLETFRFDSDAGDQLTLKEYFKKMLLTLWREKECFDGKRPFGNSDWDAELLVILGRNQIIDLGFGKDRDPDDWYLPSSVHERGNELIKEFIEQVL